MAMTSYFDQPTSRVDDDLTLKQQIGRVISPTSAHELVGPPPDSPPAHEVGRSTPLSGTLAYAPKEAVAKNRDTAAGQASYNTGNATGVSNPPDGGAVRSIVNPAQSVQPAQGIRPAQPAQAVRPALMNPDNNASLRPGGNGAMPVLPAGAPTQVQGPSQLDLAQNKLNSLTSAPGISGIKNGFLRGAARVGDVLAQELPGIGAAIPNTTPNRNIQIARQQGIVGNLQGQQQAAATLEDTRQQGVERAALADKADALAQSDKPMNPTPEQAVAVGHPEIANLPIPQRTYSAMLVAKQRADAAEAVGKGHDQARVTVGQGNNATAVQVGAGHDAARVSTSKYSPGNRGTGTGTGTGAATPSAEPGDLSGVPANMRGLVQAIGEGREGPAPLGRKDGKEIMRLVSQVYPDYDASQFHNYQATRAEFGKGKTGQAINSFNTALQHLGRMETNLPHNTSLPAANWLINTAKDVTGSAANTPFEADRIAVASEIGKAYKGGVLTKEENDQYQKLLDRDASPAQQKANIAELKGLLAGKLDSFSEQYKTGLPTGATRNFQIISPEAAKVLNRTPQAAAQPANSGGQLPPQAAKVLTEGKVHTFNNGQKWTLRNGHPERVQ